MARIPVGMQLYTVRDHTAKDYVATLKQVAAMGYAGVEFTEYGGLSAQDLKKALDDLGLRPVGSHIELVKLFNGVNEHIDYCLTIGCHRIVVPWLPHEFRRNGEDYVNLGVRLNAVGDECRRQGVQLCYHSHDFEFLKYDGRYAIDLLYGACGTDLVKAELDTYWVTRAGEDPAAWIQKLAGRCPLLHVKDMEGDGEQFFTEVGSGVVNFESVFSVAEQAGIEWFLVEHDQPRMDSLESVRKSIEYLKSRAVA